MKISVDRLFSHDVESIEVDERLALRGDLKDRYPRGVRVKATISKMSRGVYVEGNVEGMELETCARCLDEFMRAARVEIAEPYGEDVAPSDAQFADIASLVDREIDLDSLVTELLEVDEPMAAICSPDCKGICPTCGANRNRETCTCADTATNANEDAPDDRLAGLAKWLQERDE